MWEHQSKPCLRKEKSPLTEIHHIRSAHRNKLRTNKQKKTASQAWVIHSTALQQHEETIAVSLMVNAQLAFSYSFSGFIALTVLTSNLCQTGLHFLKFLLYFASSLLSNFSWYQTQTVINLWAVVTCFSSCEKAATNETMVACLGTSRPPPPSAFLTNVQSLD